MKSRVFRSIVLIALFTMVMTTMVITALIRKDIEQDTQKTMAVEIEYIEAAMEAGGTDFLTILASHGDGNSAKRITWIDTDGTVLYDSYVNPEQMENHGSRPEVVEAIETGAGESVRRSDTLSAQTYYHAKDLSDGTVIRIATTVESQLASFVGLIPTMIFMAICVFVVAILLARVETRRIVAPINLLNPDFPMEKKVYPELSPLIIRLEKQRKMIQNQMQTLKERQDEFAAITENMCEGFMIIDSKANVISYNSSAMRILGVDMEKELDGRNNVLNFNRSKEFRQAVDSALQGYRNEQTLDLDGRSYQIIANPVEETEEKKGAVVVILDVTEKKGRDELRREFSANVSHELKTPLTSISGYAEIMKSGMVQPADMERFSEKIYTEAQRLITLVGDIIKISQLDEDQVQIEKEPIDLYEEATDVVTRLQDYASRQQVSLELVGTCAIVNGSKRILNEMLYNLCDNAVKYNKPGGTVWVNIDVENDHPTFSVEDDGIGIPKAEQGRIFERFYRVDKSHSKQIGGTGLGLSIVKHGAIYHKANVELKSAMGRGTQIKIVF